MPTLAGMKLWLAVAITAVTFVLATVGAYLHVMRGQHAAGYALCIAGMALSFGSMLAA